MWRLVLLCFGLVAQSSFLCATDPGLYSPDEGDETEDYGEVDEDILIEDEVDSNDDEGVQQ